MSCPQCGAPLTLEVFATEGPPTTAMPSALGVCPCCARSLVKEGDGISTATLVDIQHLTPAQIAKLRQARPAAWRASVKARHAQIVGAK